MKKHKILCTLLAVAMTVVSMMSLTACSQSSRGDGEIWIEASYAGYGEEWLNGIAEKYEEETGVHVEINWDANLTTNISNLMERNKNMSDIYYVNLSGGTSEFRWNLQGKLESLNDVFAADNGTGKTIESTIKPGFEDAGKYKGTRYAIYTMSGYDCLIYNPDILEAAGWNKPFPSTVDELVEMFKVIKKANLKAGDGTTIMPFVYFGKYNSCSHLFDAFELQYGGLEEYKAYYNQTSLNGPDESQYNKKSTKVAFENIKKILAVDQDGRLEYAIDGSQNFDHTTAQARFLNGYAAVCTTGTWFETEMREIIEADDKFEIAPFPLATDENGGYGAAVNYLIDPNGEVTPENMMKYNTVTFAGSPFYVPKKAPNKEGAKDFLKFLLQEENIRFMHEKTGNALNFVYNRENLNLTEWAQKVEANNLISITGAKGSNNPIYLVGALGGYRDTVWPGLETNKDYNYLQAMADRLTDAKYNWKDKVSLI